MGNERIIRVQEHPEGNQVILSFITPVGVFRPPEGCLGPWFKTTVFQTYCLSVDGLVRQFFMPSAFNWWSLTFAVKIVAAVKKDLQFSKIIEICTVFLKSITNIRSPFDEID